MPDLAITFEFSFEVRVAVRFREYHSDHVRSEVAEKWFRAAAEKGHGTAQMNLAMLLPLGCAATTSCDHHIHCIDHDKTSHRLPTDFSHLLPTDVPQTSQVEPR